MKKIILLSFSTVLLMSCKNESRVEPSKDAVEAEMPTTIESNDEVQILKDLSDSIFTAIEKNQKGTITRAEFDEYALPLQAQFDSIHSTLSEAEKQEIKEHRTERFNAMVDRLAE